MNEEGISAAQGDNAVVEIVAMEAQNDDNQIGCRLANMVNRLTEELEALRLKHGRIMQ